MFPFGFSWWFPPAPQPVVALPPAGGTVSTAANPVEQYKDVPARALTKDEAMAILKKLHQDGALKLAEGKIRDLDILPWGVTIKDFQIGGAKFAFTKSMPMIDPRLAVLIYRLAEHLQEEHQATGMVSMGFNRSSDRPEFSSHNQGRAFDFKGVLFEDTRDRTKAELLDPLNTRHITVLNHWGKLPILHEGKLVSAKVHYKTNPTQERLNEDIVVDRDLYYAVMGRDPAAHPWNETMEAEAQTLQEQLRRAAKVFRGMLDFFAGQATVRAPVFSKQAQTVTMTSTGNICSPDGSSWSGHQDHYHVQIGVTGWVSDFAGTTDQVPSAIAESVRKRIYAITQDAIWSRLKKARDDLIAAEKKDRETWEKRNKDLPEGAPGWEDQPKAAEHRRKVTIAEAYQDDALRSRIYSVDGVEEFAPKDNVAGKLWEVNWSTQRGRVLTKWYWAIASDNNPPAWLFPKGWPEDPSLSAEQVQDELLQIINDVLDKAREAGLAA